MENMIKKIEDAVLERLKLNWPGVGEFDIGKDFASILKTPVISVTTEKIDVKAASSSGMLAVSGSYELHPTVSIYTVFKSVQPGPRRDGIYPLVTIAASLLLGQNLGLDIEPFEPDGPIVEIFNQSLSNAGLVAFKIDLKTAFELEAFIDKDELTKLLITANDYLYRDHEFETQKIEYDKEEAYNYVP